MNTDWIENNTLQEKLIYLESQLEEAKIRLSQYEDNSGNENIISLSSNASFRYALHFASNISAPLI